MPVRYSGGGSSYSGRSKRTKSKSATRKTKKATRKTKRVVQSSSEEPPKRKKIETKMPDRPTVMARDNVERVLKEIVRAGTERKEIEVLYMAKDGKRSRRRMEPYSFRRNASGIVLYGHCMLRDGLRSFLVRNIQEVYVLSARFSPRHSVTLKKDFEELRSQFRA